MKCEIKEVLLNPEQRERHIESLLRLDGLGSIKEVRDGIYCAVPLTGAPVDMRNFIHEEHEKIKECIKNAGLKIYDPKDAPQNPWIKITDKPQMVYDTDTLQVVTPRFFEFTNVFPTTGGGIEEQKAINYVKIPVVVVKNGTYTSRMSTGARRIILLEYDNAKKQQKEITDVFLTLRKYEPGIGICSFHGNTLLGFSKSGETFCLPGLVEDLFPQLTYNFDKYVKS